MEKSQNLFSKGGRLLGTKEYNTKSKTKYFKQEGAGNVYSSKFKPNLRGTWGWVVLMMWIKTIVAGYLAKQEEWVKHHRVWEQTSRFIYLKE